MALASMRLQCMSTFYRLTDDMMSDDNVFTVFPCHKKPIICLINYCFVICMRTN